MSVVDKAVEDGIDIGGVADGGVPVGDGNLAGEQGRSAAIALFEGLQQIVPGLGAQALWAPVVEDKQIHAAKAFEPASEAAVAMGDGQLIEKLRRADGEHGSVIVTGLLAGGRIPTNSCLRRSDR